MWKQRIRSWIPNSFTFGNLFCGVLAIAYAASGDFSNATSLIIIAMMLDSLDGRLARMLDVAGDFGKELDSLADVVTFGVAPAMLAYYTFFIDYGQAGLFFAALFPLFGAYRLARFNLSATNVAASYFQGVPITAAGGVLAVVSTFGDRISELLIPVFFTGLALLMVSRVRIPSFKDVPLPRHSFIITISLVYLTYMIVARWKEWPTFWFFAIVFYVLFIAFSFVKKRRRSSDS